MSGFGARPAPILQQLLPQKPAQPEDQTGTRPAPAFKLKPTSLKRWQLATQRFARTWRSSTYVGLKILVASIGALGGQRAIFHDASQTGRAQSQRPYAVHSVALKSSSRL